MDFQMPDHVHYHPDLIFSLGTQVVTLIDIPGAGDVNQRDNLGTKGKDEVRMVVDVVRHLEVHLFQSSFLPSSLILTSFGSKRATMSTRSDC